MTLIYFGTDQYSAVALRYILENRNTGILEHIFVVTDKHEGGSPVEKLAREHDLDVSYYSDFSLLTPACAGRSPFSPSDLPIGLCASFDHLIPQDIISQFAGNLYNLHPSLLPQYRNVSPVQYALALGDQETGITLFRISPGIDDGEIIAQAAEPILESDTTPTLTPRLFHLGAKLFLEALKSDFVPTGKPENGRTGELIFTKRLKKESGFIEWSVLQKLLSGKTIDPSDTKNELLYLRLTHNPTGSILSDLLRALTPWPGIWSLVPSKKGELRIALILPLTSPLSLLTLKILIAGKPKAISITDFKKYYL